MSCIEKTTICLISNFFIFTILFVEMENMQFSKLLISKGLSWPYLFSCLDVNSPLLESLILSLFCVFPLASVWLPTVMEPINSLWWQHFFSVEIHSAVMMTLNVNTTLTRLFKDRHLSDEFHRTLLWFV